VSEVRVLSPAKINLLLEILGRRRDGYHEIRTLIQLVDLFDEILFERLEEGVELRVFGLSDHVPKDQDNLVLGAARLLFKEMGTSGGVSITLYKRIPSAAGLGGGSSNAAATLWGLKILFGFPISKARLRELALSLGSDVPFFFSSGCAFGEGRGELLKEVRLPCKPVVIIYPGFGVSSGWAYERKKLKLTKRGKKDNLKRLYYESSLEELPPFSVNELEEVVAEKYPLIRDLKRALLNSGARLALMSGSGSSVYGLFDDRTKAAEAARYWRAQNYWVHEGKTLDFNPLIAEEGKVSNGAFS